MTTFPATFSPDLRQPVIAGILALAGMFSLPLAGLSATTFRTLDGSYNNELNETWGMAGTPFIRMAPADYPGDGSGSTMIASVERPNARILSNALFSQTTDLPSSYSLSSGVWQWGQFIDHDFTLVENGFEFGRTIIPAPADDPDGMTVIGFSRSAFDRTTGTTASNPRQQINSISSYIDGSGVYGSDLHHAHALRERVGGRLKMSDDGLLPLSNADFELAGVEMDAGPLGADPVFVAGDIRANEQPGLAALHTLFVREHNRLADQLATYHAGDDTWDDERIYQTARAIVGAEIQAITYNEFLPALLGAHAPRAEDYGYDPSINPSIANEFAGALFRVGHTMLNPELLLVDDTGSVTGHIDLRSGFFRPDLLSDNPHLVEDVLMGLTKQTAQEIDGKLIDDVRSFLFAPTGGVGSDLAALNIQRGRDHGLPDYNSLREAYGLERISSFAELTTDESAQATLATMYDSIDNVDPFVGALFEEHVDGASVGPLIMTAMIDQFSRLRDGDSFFFAGQDFLMSNEVASMVDFSTMTLMDVIDWNTGLGGSGLPGSFFFSPQNVPEPGTLLLLALVALAPCRPLRQA